MTRHSRSFRNALPFSLQAASALRGCVAAAILTGTVIACAGDAPPEDSGVQLDYEHYILANGLEVVLHVDRSDPVVAVTLTYHVGSAKEVEGRTGFAHLFEHLFFLDSENLGPGGLDRLMTRVGSSTNGSTNRDRTDYFELVPRDALEKTLWAEADKVGFFINTVTEDVVAKEKQVVKNEKRQGVDNQPYGHLNYVVDRALYPEGHPYRWQVIGSLADLDAATLADVHEFHERWYGPGNALLVVSGDLDVEQTKEWIERYFGEIPGRPAPELPAPPEVALAESRRLMHEDNFAQLPQLTLAWPTVPNYHPDSYALGLLARILTDGKTSPFYQVIVEEMGVAPGASASNFTQELAGRFSVQIRAYPDQDLNEVLEGVERAFARFEERGVPPEELARVKAGVERFFYLSLSGVSGKAFQLAHYTMFAGDPGYAEEDLDRTLAVTEADLVRVYELYLKDRPWVAASFVPRGRADLALTDSEVAEVVIEPIVQGAEAPVEVLDRGGIARTPSAIDRSVEPPFGETPTLVAPTVWRAELANGLPVLGIEDREIPLVQFHLRIDGGALLDSEGKEGAGNLLAETMLQGTAQRTPEELELAIQLLGAYLNVSAGRDAFVISGTTLARNFAETMALLEEVLLEPRFDPAEFDLARLRVQSQIRQQAGNPNSIAGAVFSRLVYGDHPLARNPLGTESSVEGVTIDDLRAWHSTSLVPGLAAFHVAGAVSSAEVEAAAEGLGVRWSVAPAPELPGDPEWDPGRAGVYFVDVPGAAQSVLRIGYLAMAEPDPDYWPATVMNFRLGGGGFASELTQVLREGLGYTYGVGSSFQGGGYPGPFQIGSGVRSNVTLESLQEIRRIMEAHGPEFTDEDMEVTRGFLLRNNAGAFETLGAKVGLLASMSAYGFPADFALRRASEAQSMSVDRIRELSARYLDPTGMIWLAVGDSATQLQRLSELGLGAPVLLDREGAPVGGG